MEIFLKRIASDLYNKHGENINQLTLVFPNRRAGIFFLKYLNDLLEQPLISPEILTINELFTASSDSFVPDRLNLIIRLYKVYRELTASTESFDDFYYWGGMLVSDFDQIDKYLVNATDLFTNIRELKEIDERFNSLQPENKETLENFWKSVLIEKQTSNQEEFVRLWKDLAEIYHRFKADLSSKGLAYEGMVYRSVVEQLSCGKDTYFRDKKFVFIGFNALNQCEKELFTFLLKTGNALFYWDYDDYYLKDKNQEAGYFMRENLERFPQTEFPFTSNSFARKGKAMKILNVTSQIGQSQSVGEEITRLLKSTETFGFDNTAVVLCDEELLLPVISALPDEAKKVNITMGFPMKMTPVYNLINHLNDLLINAKKQGEGTLFYFTNVLAILNNPLILSINQNDCNQLSASIKTNNQVYLAQTELSGNKIFQLVFTLPETIAELSKYFLEILEYLFVFWEKKEGSENTILIREYLYQAFLAINRLKDNLLTDGFDLFGNIDFISVRTFFRLLDHYLNEQNIPFQGEPVEGLQVMGILETRALDFQNLVILSLNDGIMPGISFSGSFIPFNLRRVYGLPTLEEQNAMYAYYFYRLIQRAEDITFVYNSCSNGLTTGEKSRYLYQLQIESCLEVSEYSLVYKLDHRNKKEIIIPKSGEVLPLLRRFIDENHALSPTALDKYLTCTLLFYFRHVVCLKEPEEISEEVDPKIFGQLFHKSMENLYLPYVGKILRREMIENLINDHSHVEKIIDDAFLEIYFKGFKKESKIQYSGKNYLIFEILRKYIFRILELDKNRAPFVIEGLESKVSMPLSLNSSIKIKLEGYIDRIDRINGGIQILDYKTGKTDLSYPMLNTLFERESKNRNKAAFQTLVYSYILHKNHPGENSIRPGILNLRGLFEESYDPCIRSKENGNMPVEFIKIADQFETLLLSLLNEIFDSTIPFQKTAVEENCTFCTYRQICER